MKMLIILVTMMMMIMMMMMVLLSVGRLLSLSLWQRGCVVRFVDLHSSDIVIF